MSDNFKDVDRLGCESCPDNPENREYMQQRGVSVSGVDGRPKGNPVLEAIDDAIQPESGGITTEQHNEMLDNIRAAYLQHHPQGPDVAGRTTSYYICPQCKTPIDMTGTGLDGLVATGNGGEFERAIAQLYPDGYYHGAFYRITTAHNTASAEDKCRISKLWQERDLTIAHDSQPYPTAEAYEKACQENERRRQRIAELEAQLAEWKSRLTAVMPKDMKCWHQNSEKEWPEVAAWVIENQRKHIDEFWMPRVEYLEKQVSGLEEQLSAVKKPRVMKRWDTKEVKRLASAGDDEIWIRYIGFDNLSASYKNGREVIEREKLFNISIEGGTIGLCKITHFLAAEQKPTLPETNGDMIAGDGD